MCWMWCAALQLSKLSSFSRSEYNRPSAPIGQKEYNMEWIQLCGEGGGEASLKQHHCRYNYQRQKTQSHL
jgi:uncharacterized protein YdgA (DUF945 family)